MERTWKPTAAGVLCIIVGVIVMILTMAGALLFEYVGVWLCSLVGIPFIAAPLIIVGIIAIVAIVGGIYALRRRVWGLALAGSIFALIVPVTLVILAMFFFIGADAAIGVINFTIPEILAGFTILAIPGILAIIFVIKGKGEFK